MPVIHSFSDFEDLLTLRLNRPLPGRQAHQRMAGSRYHQWPEPGEKSRSSAVLILFYPEGNEVAFPVIMRPVYQGVHSGQVAFPGGKADPSDRDLDDTALREAWEEIRAPREKVTLLGRLSEIYIAASDINVVPVVGTLPFKPLFVPDPREVQAIREVRLSGLRDQQIVKEGRFAVKGGFVKAPFYDYEGLQIWGATAMMISELLEILQT